MNQVEFLGFIVDAQGIRADPKKIEKILNFPKPHDVTTVQSFLGIVNFYRRFIRNCSKISRPLIDLTMKDTPFIWTDKC